MCHETHRLAQLAIRTALVGNWIRRICAAAGLSAFAPSYAMVLHPTAGAVRCWQHYSTQSGSSIVLTIQPRTSGEGLEVASTGPPLGPPVASQAITLWVTVPALCLWHLVVTQSPTPTASISPFVFMARTLQDIVLPGNFRNP
jgi:hypothetical protein